MAIAPSEPVSPLAPVSPVSPLAPVSPVFPLSPAAPLSPVTKPKFKAFALIVHVGVDPEFNFVTVN